jgi:hypothetical protein
MKKLMICVFATALAGVAFSKSLPANNAWDSAEEIDNTQYSGDTRTVNNGDATEPQGDPLCALGDYGRTLWYKWTAPANGLVQFSTKDSYVGESPYPQLDTVLGVFVLDDNGKPKPTYDSFGDLAFNDDAYTNKTSFIELQQVYAGETYYIGVGTKPASSALQTYEAGYIMLSWSYTREWARVVFNAQGGTTTSQSLRLLGGFPLATFGDMPEPVRGGFDFGGWFTDPVGGVEVTGAESYDTLRDYIVEGYLNLYAHWTSIGTETPQLGPFNKSQTFMGAFLTTGYGVVGSVTIKVGKKSAKNTTRVTATVIRYETGRKVTGKGTLTINDDGSAESDDMVFKFNDEKRPDDTMRMKVQPDGTFEMKGAHYLVEATQVGGALTVENLTFSVRGFDGNSAVFSLPRAQAGAAVITEALPVSFTFPLDKQGRKFAIPSGQFLKYQPARGDVRAAAILRQTEVAGSRRLKMYELVGLGDSNPNKSKLKLSYAHKTGLFKGSFYVYTTTGYNYINNGGTREVGKPKLTKMSVKVVGIVMAGRGFGMATLKSTGQEWFAGLNP